MYEYGESCSNSENKKFPKLSSSESILLNNSDESIFFFFNADDIDDEVVVTRGKEKNYQPFEYLNIVNTQNTQEKVDTIPQHVLDKITHIARLQSLRENIFIVLNATQINNRFLIVARHFIMKIPAELSECNNEGECQGDTYLVCKNFKCICPEEKIWVENKCGETKSMIGHMVNFQLFFESNKVYKSPICSEMRITEVSDSLTYKLPVSLGSVTIKVTVDNKDIDQDKSFNTEDYEDFCFILYRKISGDNSRPKPPILGEIGNFLRPNIITEDLLT
ncbi:hypothetical protein BpHYR1_016166 [Brachionus plicatilis]|uniref:Uncharacterized protein n=1 Tax=Brachionus plicatilis TaxID=10195 RepID=A0A3M7Q9I5_BRAPC|nr:hypothetical protein BpHYR1_016166 [Brachionus plicatilis]